MFIKDISFKKAAFFFAAFFISHSTARASQSDLKGLEHIKQKAKTFLAQNKKKEALLLFSNFMKIETNKVLIAEAAEILVRLSQTFVSKESQDAYEASINLTNDNLKESKKLNEACLTIEPQNLNCLIQKIKILCLEKNKIEAQKVFNEELVFAQGTLAAFWIEAQLNKENNLSVFKTKNLIKKFNEKPSEDIFILTVLEIERSFAVKNFSRVKEGIEYLEKNYSEFPDIDFFKQKLELESAEVVTSNTQEVSPMYATKCKNLSKSVARKFRFDFNMCQRSNL